MPQKLRPIGLAVFALIFVFALVAITGKAEAQTTNCMSMGSDMVHCDTIGSGGMSGTDCMAMGPDMMTCNSMGGGGSGGPVASPVDVYRFIFGDRTRKNIGRMLANGDCEGAARYAYEKGRLELGNQIAQTCRPSDARTNAPSRTARERTPSTPQIQTIVRPRVTVITTPAPGVRPPANGQSPNQAQQLTGSLYQTVDYLARNVSVPFTVDAAAGTFAVTKIEAFDTQLHMNVQATDSRLSLADAASPANLQVICADPNFSEVLRLGGSIRLTFVRKNGTVLGGVTQTNQSCRF